MIFGFRKKKAAEEEREEEEIEQVLFQGPLNGTTVDLKSHAQLAQLGLGPAKSVITNALLRRANAVRIEPKGDRAVIMLSIDGVPYPGGQMPAKKGLAVTQMIKLLSGLNPRERGKPQSGGCRAEFQETPYELRVDSTPLKGGAERLTVRVRNLKEKRETPADLGIPEEMRKTLREMASHRSGALLTCGPPNSGTSTTSFAVLRTIDAYLYNIYSIAGDTEGRELVNITDFEANPEDDLEATLQRCTRAEADVVFLDPIRDAETAKSVFKMQEKVTLLSEFRAKDAAHGIEQLIEWVRKPKVVAEGLRGIVSQKLIRRLCPECREAYPPNPKLVQKVGLPPETQVLYRPFKAPPPEKGEEPPEPCETCGGLGYYGRVAMFEVIEMSEGMRQLVAKGPTADEVRALARKEKLRTLQKDGLRLVAEGTTALEELQRVFKSS